MKNGAPAVVTFTGVKTLYFVFLLIFSLASGILMAAPAANAFENLSAGMKAPNFTLKGVDGRTMGFSDIKGQKLTVLLFWSTWSAYSPDALKQMEQIYNKYKNRGLSVVAIDVDSQDITTGTLSQIKAETDRMKLGFPVTLDCGLTAFHDYGVMAVPSTVILDKNRVIKYELAGFPLMGSADMANYIASRFRQ